MFLWGPSDNTTASRFLEGVSRERLWIPSGFTKGNTTFYNTLLILLTSAYYVGMNDYNLASAVRPKLLQRGVLYTFSQLPQPCYLSKPWEHCLVNQVDNQPADKALYIIVLACSLVHVEACMHQLYMYGHACEHVCRANVWLACGREMEGGNTHARGL